MSHILVCQCLKTSVILSYIVDTFKISLPFKDYYVNSSYIFVIDFTTIDTPVLLVVGKDLGVKAPKSFITFYYFLSKNLPKKPVSALAVGATLVYI